MLALKLHQIYEEILNKNNSKYRIINRKHKNGDQREDPIYQKLGQNTNFSTLLHEKPLYLMNKSLLLENEGLYSQAINLYKTRNKIVHLGEPESSPQKNDLLSIDGDGAKKAYNIAVDVFAWMNLKGYKKI